MIRLNVKIVVATHKKYPMPKDEIYIPLHVGAEGKTDDNGNELNLGYTKDNTGDNISALNSGFCELTALYWAWKNLDADYIGLAHYRRHFSSNGRNVITSNELTPMIEKYKVIVPKKRRYYIETLYSHYEHTHDKNHLDKIRTIINEQCPEYVEAFDKVMKQRSGYMFNMMIMEKRLLNEYCKWLFDILFELRGRIDASGLSFFQGRFYGRVSELLFNVWLERMIESGKLRKTDIAELPCMYTEKIDWWKKGTSFLRAKFLHEKYSASF